MSWFGEQIQNRIRRDRSSVSDALLQIADSVGGKARFHAKESKADRMRSEIAIVCHFFELEVPEDIPETEDVNELFDYILRPLGIMRRRVILEDRWWKNGDGPLLAVEKDTGMMRALLPGFFSGYWYYDTAADDYIQVKASEVDRFEAEAVCLYRPLPQKPMSGRALIDFLLHNMSIGDAVMILLSILLMTLVGALTPLITAEIFYLIIPSGKYSLLYSALMLLIAAAVGGFLFRSVKMAVMSRISGRMDTLLQNGLIGRMLGLPVKFFSDKSAGALSQSMSALTLLPSILTEVFFGTGITVAMSLLYIVQVVVLEPTLAWPALATFIMELLLIALCMGQKHRVIRNQLKAEESTQGLVFALFSGIQKIKLSGSENRAFAKWAQLYSARSTASYRRPFPAFMQEHLFVAIQMFGLMFAYNAAMSSGVSTASFAAFSSSFGMIMAALGQLSSSTDLVAYLRPVLEAGSTLLQAVPETSAVKKTVQKLSGSIELNNVSFRYDKDGPNIVDHMNLKIRAGEYVAIVGQSGCGKSTLMRLLLGFEEPDEGSISYDNRDLSTLDLASFRRNVGTVLQSGKLFAGDIFSNITIAAPWLKMDDAWKAAQMAGMAEDIEAMPMGMRTIISEGSGGISGGQRQRLMIARAIAPKPSILMFDEATSALDNITQKTVSDSLNALKCTRIVIAHRLSTIRECDRIIMLDAGRIVEDGTYDALIAQNGRFADLVRRQQVDVR